MLTEAVESGYSPAKLRYLLVTLVMDGAPAPDLLESNTEILIADLSELPGTPVD